MTLAKSVTRGTRLMLGAALLGITGVWASGQGVAPQPTRQPTQAQQQQLDRVQQLGERLGRDRQALDEAVIQHGWDSDEADQAQEILARDRAEFRSLRRSLRAAGVDLSAAAESSAGNDAGGCCDHSSAPGDECCRHGEDGHCCHARGADCCQGHGSDCCHGHGAGCCGSRGR
jgi:hypothetical protein